MDDQESVESTTKKSSVSSGGPTQNQDRKEFLHRFVDSEVLISLLMSWLDDISKDNAFDVPFESIDLQKFDYALEAVPFQQLTRMPSSIYESTSTTAKSTAYLALEDFLHASVTGLWDTFWGHENDITPFYVASLDDANLRFYQAEEAIAKGKIGGLCASAIMLKNPRHPQGKWDDIVELALLRRNVGNLSKPHISIIGEALFFALRVLLARSISRTNVPLSLSPVFVVLVDSQYGGVVSVDGDLRKLEFDLDNVYESAALWIKNHSRVAISKVDKIWNKLGNANWGDIGAVQVLYSTFHSIAQYVGTPHNTIEDLAADHSSRLHTRRLERQSEDNNEKGLFRFQHRAVSPEIVEIREEEESVRVGLAGSPKLEIGSVLMLEDSNGEKGYRIDEVFINDVEVPFYIASSIEDPRKPLFLYVGSHLSHLEPAWEDMRLWYQVQRQTKVLNVMKQNGLSSKYLPQVAASGRVTHPGHCRRTSTTGGNCHYPFCGTPVLVTGPVGTSVANMAARFDSDEAIMCCHDILSALSIAASSGIRHGNIMPENVIRVKPDMRRAYYVLIGWGHAILEERDRPALNLHFSSTSGLQEGKLCSASDAESLVYMLYFCSGGDLPVLDSVEGALQWRETAWSRRLIQQRLGEISAVLKAFADYIDSLCGTPYPVDYEIWLRRLKRQISDEDGSEVEMSR